MLYSWHSAWDVGVCTVKHLHSVWTVLRVEASHDQTHDHDEQADQHQDGGDQVVNMVPAASGEFEEAGRWKDEDQGRGAQRALDSGEEHR